MIFQHKKIKALKIHKQTGQVNGHIGKAHQWQGKKRDLCGIWLEMDGVLSSIYGAVIQREMDVEDDNNSWFANEATKLGIGRRQNQPWICDGWWVEEGQLPKQWWVLSSLPNQKTALYFLKPLNRLATQNKLSKYPLSYKTKKEK